MTLANLYERVHQRTGQLARRQEDDNLATTSAREQLLKLYAADALTKLARATGRAEAKATHTLVAGQASYALPEVVGAPILVAVDSPDGRQLELTHAAGAQIAAAAAKEAAAGEDGQPTAFGIFAETLWLWHVPSSEYGGQTLHIYYESASWEGEADSALDTDEAPEGDILATLPPEYETPLVDFVIGQWLMDSGELALADPYLTRFERELTRSKPRQVKLFKRKYRGI